jgi:hypothetical protein
LRETGRPFAFPVVRPADEGERPPGQASSDPLPIPFRLENANAFSDLFRAHRLAAWKYTYAAQETVDGGGCFAVK